MDTIPDSFTRGARFAYPSDYPIGGTPKQIHDYRLAKLRAGQFLPMRLPSRFTNLDEYRDHMRRQSKSRAAYMKLQRQLLTRGDGGADARACGLKELKLMAWKSGLKVSPEAEKAWKKKIKAVSMGRIDAIVRYAVSSGATTLSAGDINQVE